MALVTESAATRRSFLRLRTLPAELPGAWPNACRTSPATHTAPSHNVERMSKTQKFKTPEQFLLDIVPTRQTEEYGMSCVLAKCLKPQAARSCMQSEVCE